jgi:hypothetical protein
MDGVHLVLVFCERTAVSEPLLEPGETAEPLVGGLMGISRGGRIGVPRFAASVSGRFVIFSAEAEPGRKPK